MKRSSLLPILFLVLSLILMNSVAAQSRKNMSSRERKGEPPPASEPVVKATQMPEPAIEAEEQIKLNVDLVVLDALVFDQKTSRIIGNLKKEDIKLYEDGIQQTITHFSHDSLPLSVVLLVDRGGCLDPFGNEMRHATIEALNRLKPEDEVALMTFADSTDLIFPFGTSRNRIADAVYRVPDHHEESPHCFNRAFYEAAHYMDQAANPDGRRVIIMITATNKAFDCPGVSGEEARQAILESGSVVCGLMPKTAAQRVEDRAMAAITGIGGLMKLKSSNLKQLAEETGGEIMNDKPEDLNRAFNNLIDHLRTRYSIGFVSTNTKRDGSFRKLKAEVSPSVRQREGNLVVRTRRGYLAGEAASKNRSTHDINPHTQK